MAHMPFGWGPRNCIGLRFALLEAKIALMEILKKFSFAQGPETVVWQQPLLFNSDMVIVIIPHTVTLSLHSVQT